MGFDKKIKNRHIVTIFFRKIINMNKIDTIIYLPVWLKNVLYLFGIVIIVFPVLLINYLLIDAQNNNSDIAISFDIFDYIYFINPIFISLILIIPAIILDKIQKTKLLYSIGLNFDKFALRDIVIGMFIGFLSISIIGIIFFINYSDLIIQVPKQLHYTSIIITFFIAFNEEFFFRGYIFQNIYRKNNSIFVVIINSLLFASAHFIATDFEIIYFLNIFIAGVLLCVMYIKTKSLWCSISFHFAWNMISTSNNFIEYHYICGVVLLINIFICLKILKPSYRINKYYFIN